MANKVIPIHQAEEDSSLFPPADPTAYDAWFREEVEAGMREADDPNTVMIPHAEVIKHLHTLRAEWRARAETMRDVA